MRLEQTWNMFSRPLSEDGWYECSGKLRGGKCREEEEEEEEEEGETEFFYKSHGFHVFTFHLSSSFLFFFSPLLLFFSSLLFFSAGTELDLMGWGGPVPRKMRLINVNDWTNENVIPMTTHGGKRPEWYYRRYASQR